MTDRLCLTCGYYVATVAGQCESCAASGEDVERRPQPVLPSICSRWFPVQRDGRLSPLSSVTREGAESVARATGCTSIVFCAVTPDPFTVIAVDPAPIAGPVVPHDG